MTHISSRANAHSALVEQLQGEFFAEDLHPPPEACNWSTDLLRRWFSEGGVLSMGALLAEPMGQRDRHIDEVGAELPVCSIAPVGSDPGALECARNEDADFFAHLAKRLGHDGYVSTRLFGRSPATDAVFEAACAEGSTLLSRMRPGASQGTKGYSEGTSPSGAARGDRFLFVSETTRLGDYPALASVDEAITTVGAALARAVAQEPSLQLEILKRSDGLFACFPGDAGSPGYGAHLDGDAATCRLSMICYFNVGWEVAAHGGELHMLDERNRCWRAVAPMADTLVVFLSRDVLHRVAASSGRRRFALTSFWSVGQNSAGQEDVHA